MVEKAFFRFAFWLPYALPLAVLTVVGTEPLTVFYVWGTFHIPPNASQNSPLEALALEVFTFLILLAVPKVVIYFWGKPRPNLKIALLNITTFFVLPILAWFVLSATLAHIAWLLIAFAAWIEALQIILASKLPERIRTFWHLD